MKYTIKLPHDPVSGFITPKDDQGVETPVQQGTVSYSSSNESVVTVEEDPSDETKFTVTFVGAGTAQINASADADPREGEEDVRTITDSIDIEVEPDMATTLNIQLQGISPDQ